MNRFTFFWLVLTSVFVSAETRELYILHTNDIHGYVESYEGGGLERIATLEATVKAASSTAGIVPTPTTPPPSKRLPTAALPA